MRRVEFHRSNGVSIVNRLDMVRTKFTTRKTCIRPRKFKIPRPLVEAEILLIKTETSSEEPQELFRDPDENPEGDP